MQIAVGSESIWKKFAPVANLNAADPRFAVNLARVGNREELIAAIEAEFADRTRSDVLAVLEAAGVPVGSIRTIDEVYEWEQTRSQGLVVEVDHSVVGPVQLPGPSLRMETAHGQSLVRADHAAPPTLGQHTEQILAWIDAGCDGDQAPHEHGHMATSRS